MRTPIAEIAVGLLHQNIDGSRSERKTGSERTIVINDSSPHFADRRGDTVHPKQGTALLLQKLFKTQLILLMQDVLICMF